MVDNGKSLYKMDDIWGYPYDSGSNRYNEVCDGDGGFDETFNVTFL